MCRPVCAKVTGCACAAALQQRLSAGVHTRFDERAYVAELLLARQELAESGAAGTAKAASEAQARSPGRLLSLVRT